MTVTVKNSFALLLLLTFAPLTAARPADAPLRKALLLPSEQSEVVPRRALRPISRLEIFQAIQNDLAHRGISGRAKLQPEDLNIQSAAPSLKADAGLKIKKVAYDPLRREVVFELWASGEPEYLPFEVTTRRDPGSLGFSSALVRQGPEEGGNNGTESPNNGAPSRSSGTVLAHPGVFATLVMLGENVRITTTVVPLQPGSKGQSILVRDTTTARVMSAQVVDANLLQAAF